MPSVFDINLQSSPERIQELFSLHQDWGFHKKVIRIEKAGEGNMNVVLRIRLEEGNSIILKQAKSYVFKFPDIPAPLNRMDAEFAFYQAIQANDQLKRYKPAVKGYDPFNHLMVLEDLGSGSDYTFLYQKGNDSKFPASDAVEYLSQLHRLPVPESYPLNLELRLLNAEHLFEYPYRFNTGFDLDLIQPGLQDIAEPFYHSKQLREVVQALKKSYLSTGHHLIHGDFYPGSWLHSRDGFKVIDPEFSFIGHAEYDLGIMLGHCKMASVSDQVIKSILNAYHYPEAFDTEYMWQISGMEIIRRLIGLAQLPVDLSLEEKKSLLGWALKKMMM